MATSILGEHHRPLRDLVCDELRQRVIQGDFLPGDRLIEERLANDLGVSRNPVREALRVLETEGFIKILPRRGAIVAQLSERDARQIFEVRGALEPLAARLAARNITPEQEQRMQEMVADSATAFPGADSVELAERNSAFHELILEAAHNNYLRDIMTPLRGRTQWIFAQTAGKRGEEAWQEHDELSRAILTGDEDTAAALAEQHVAQARDAFLAAWSATVG